MYPPAKICARTALPAVFSDVLSSLGRLSILWSPLFVLSSSKVIVLKNYKQNHIIPGYLLWALLCRSLRCRPAQHGGKMPYCAWAITVSWFAADPHVTRLDSAFYGGTLGKYQWIYHLFRGSHLFSEWALLVQHIQGLLLLDFTHRRKVNDRKWYVVVQCVPGDTNQWKSIINNNQ